MSDKEGGGMKTTYSEEDRFHALVEAFIRQLAFFLGSGLDGREASNEIIAWMEDTGYRPKAAAVQRLLNKWRENGTLDAISSRTAERVNQATMDQIRGTARPGSKWWKDPGTVTGIFAFTSGLGGSVVELAPEGCIQEMAAVLGRAGFYDAKPKGPEKFKLASPVRPDSDPGMTLVGVPGNWMESESKEIRERGMRDYLVTLSMSYVLLFACSKMKPDEIIAAMLSWVQRIMPGNSTHSVEDLLNLWLEDGTLESFKEGIARRVHPEKLADIGYEAMPDQMLKDDARISAAVAGLTHKLGGSIGYVVAERHMYEMAHSIGLMGYYIRSNPAREERAFIWANKMWRNYLKAHSKDGWFDGAARSAAASLPASEGRDALEAVLAGKRGFSEALDSLRLDGGDQMEVMKAILERAPRSAIEECTRMTQEMIDSEQVTYANKRFARSNLILTILAYNLVAGMVGMRACESAMDSGACSTVTREGREAVRLLFGRWVEDGSIGSLGEDLIANTPPKTLESVREMVMPNEKWWSDMSRLLSVDPVNRRLPDRIPEWMHEALTNVLEVYTTSDGARQTGS